jgi:hypothetical protein
MGQGADGLNERLFDRRSARSHRRIPQAAGIAAAWIKINRARRHVSRASGRPSPRIAGRAQIPERESRRSNIFAEHIGNYLGDFGYLPDDELFFVSGAQTASWRVLGNSKYWYKDEELSDSDLNDAIALYKETRPSMVISHTAPSEAAREILKDLDGSYFLNKHGDVESRTSRALQEMFEAHQPSVGYFGHFHVNREFLTGGTTFRCLAERAISQVSEVLSAPEGIR